MITMTKSTVLIRQYTDSDLPAMIDVRNSCYPDNPDHVEEWRHWIGSMPDHCVFNILVAEQDEQIIGAGYYFHTPGMFHPRKLLMNIIVRPEQRKRGIGNQLFDRMRAAWAEIDPITLRCDAREDMTASLRFAQKHGFIEEMRSWESYLEVQNFDPTPFLAKAQQAEAGGFEFATLGEMLERDPEFKRKYHAALNEMLADVPRPDTFTPRSFEEWEPVYFSDKSLMPAAHFVALHNGEIAAVSQLWKAPLPEKLYTGLTATRRAYRRKGLALALKLRAIGFAKAHGVKEVSTGNESNNRGMLSINEALGFVKRPIWISFAWNKE
ncbi:MAG: GNAT family N-acetyltransferase [Oscillochloris sp.]|nr:GNAT family N-acetyltransferase [Oscillochloris sp.]